MEEEQHSLEVIYEEQMGENMEDGTAEDQNKETEQSCSIDDLWRLMLKQNKNMDKKFEETNRNLKEDLKNK